MSKAWQHTAHPHGAKAGQVRPVSFAEEQHRLPARAHTADPPEMEWTVDVRIGDDRRGVADEAELLALLDERSDTPRLVFLLAETGALGIGVGHPENSVILYSPCGSPQPMHALGDVNADEALGEPPLTFDGREFFARCAVSHAAARRAAKEFFASNGVLPACVEWEPEPPLAVSG